MIYLSAGHNPFGSKPDPGACAHGLREADLTVELRNLVAAQLLRQGASFTVDQDTERLAQYVGRIHPGSGSVVCEFHFNASANQSARGTETIVRKAATSTERELATAINAAVVEWTGLLSRGVKTEDKTPHGRLAILNTGAGISVLPELCFITNMNDMALYQRGKARLAKVLADLLIRYDAKFS